MKNLGARLEAALELIAKTENNKLFADIGSDHAFLAIEVLRRNIAKSAVCADINPLPLEKGRENAEKEGENIEFILSDGFASLEDREITCAAVCGMGGELTARIILQSERAKSCRLVLQPMSSQEDLRRALWENGFCIECEKFVIDCGKPYTVMSVYYDGKIRDFSYCDLFLGKERIPCGEFAKYCEKTKAAAEKRRLGLISRGKDTRDTDALICECQAHMTSF